MESFFEVKRPEDVFRIIDQFDPLGEETIRLEEAFGSWERSAGTAYGPEDWYQALVLAAREEAATVKEMVALSEFAFVEQVHFTPEALKALREETAPLVLQHCYDTLGEEDVLSPEAASAYFHRLREHFAELGGREVMFPVRAALTGSLRGPNLGVVAALLGFVRCRGRRSFLCPCTRGMCICTSAGLPCTTTHTWATARPM